MGHECQLVRVVKVGGSLFDFDLAAERLRRWLEFQPSATNVLMPGGGHPVDCVRRLERQHGFSDSFAHWMAVEMLDLNSKILANWLPEFKLVHDLRDIVKSNGHHQFVFAPLKWMRQHSKLPESWDATSDSIAAEIAEAIRIMGRPVELVLLKSCLPAAFSGKHQPASITSLQQTGLVDARFENAQKRIDLVRFVNLRNDKFETIGYESTGQLLKSITL